MLQGASDTLTLILAGGKGERLYPLTKNRTKPAVPFGGVYRIIDFPLSNCLHSGCDRIFVLVQHLSAPLIRHLWRGWNVFHRPGRGNLEVIPPQHKLADLWYRGTADAIFHNLDLLQGLRPRNVLILSGDHVYRMNYRRFLAAHEESGAQVTLAGVKVPLEEGSRFGLLENDPRGWITAFREKPEDPAPLPDDPDHCMASMGIYIFQTETLVKSLTRDARNPSSSHDFGKDILPALLDEGARLLAYDFSGNEEVPYWRDIGTVDAYYQASMDLLKDPCPFDLWDPEWPFLCHPDSSLPPRIGNGTECRSDILSPGIRLEKCVVTGSVLGPGVFVGPGARVEDSILLQDVRVGPGAVLRRCIVDAGVRIPEGAAIGLDPEKDKRLFTLSPSGLTLVPTGLPSEEGFSETLI